MSNNLLLSPVFASEKKVYLQPVSVSGVEIDICPQSGGIWFDRFELDKFDEAHEDISELMKMIPQNPKAPEITSNRRSPRHPEAIMQQQPYGPKGAQGVLTIDTCPVCAGIWIDYQELQKMRDLYPTAADKQKAIQSFVNQTFKDLKPQNDSTKKMGAITSLLIKFLQ